MNVKKPISIVSGDHENVCGLLIFRLKQKCQRSWRTPEKMPTSHCRWLTRGNDGTVCTDGMAQTVTHYWSNKDTRLDTLTYNLCCCFFLL